MANKLIHQSYYEILEISPSAGEHEIHKAYQQAKKTYSPDSPALYTMFTPEEAQDLANLIEEAYAVLSNNAARKEYDQKLTGRDMDSPQEEDKVQNLVNPVRSSMPTQLPKEVLPKSSSSNLAPEGYGRTRFSLYELDDDLEAEIKSREEFDGEFLSKVRTYKQVNLETLSQNIRVSKTYLMAIEKNDYEALPAVVFVRGFVVQYAKALGLDANKVASSYMKIMKNESHQ